MSDLTVVGAGFYGLTIARLAAEAGRTVHVHDTRPHVGGNAWSEPDPSTGIEVHRYGTHIWHTSNDRVQAWAERFTTFTAYRHTVHTRSRGRLLPLPLTLATICAFTGRALTPDEGRAWVQGNIPPDVDTTTLRGAAIAAIGEPLYEAIIAGYTAKQWQRDPADLPADIIGRLPVRYTLDTAYFNDTYQGMPTHGYGAWLTRLADHPNITVHLNSRVAPNPTTDDLLVWTGPIDAYFDRAHGHLSWRTLDLVTTVEPVGDFQGAAVINEADEHVPYTRTHEYRHLHPERPAPDDATVITREFSRWAFPDDEPYYPVRSSDDRSVLARYRHDADHLPGRVHFGGRLGSYLYLDMHMAIASALTAWDTTISTWR